MIPTSSDHILSRPQYEDDAHTILRYLQELQTTDLSLYMKISAKIAAQVYDMLHNPSPLSPAVEYFRGDIYSGLRALDFNQGQRLYAQKHLYILSGLYGLLRPYDSIQAYRLEAAYRLPDQRFKNLYKYWGDKLAKSISSNDLIINLTSAEYAKLILPYLTDNTLISPRFLTQKSANTEPVFVAVHAKIARGAFARWLICVQSNLPDFTKFNDLDYAYDSSRSSPNQPVYVCRQFGGIGLSQRTVI